MPMKSILQNVQNFANLEKSILFCIDALGKGKERRSRVSMQNFAHMQNVFEKGYLRQKSFEMRK